MCISLRPHDKQSPLSRHDFSLPYERFWRRAPVVQRMRFQLAPPPSPHPPTHPPTVCPPSGMRRERMALLFWFCLLDAVATGTVWVSDISLASLGPLTTVQPCGLCVAIPSVLRTPIDTFLLHEGKKKSKIVLQGGQFFSRTLV